jgi:hypothetical protein
MGIVFGRPPGDGRPARRKRKPAQRKKNKDEFLDTNRKRPEPEDDEEETPQLALQELYRLLSHRRIAMR